MTELERIQKISNAMRFACGAIGAVLILFFIFGISLIWSGLGYLSVDQPGIQLNFSQGDIAGTDGIATSSISIGGRFILTLGYSILTALLLKAVFHLYTLFSDYAHGEIFTADITEALKRLGVTICLWAMFPVLDAAIKVSLFFIERHNGMPGPTINVNLLPVLAWLFVGTAVVVVSWVMDAGRELSEDQKFMV